MKIRNGFVSNSSSSSFVIKKGNLTIRQLDLIKNHSSVGESYDIDFWQDEWNIKIDNNCIKGQTTMDNFDMKEFFNKIGIDIDKVEWGEWSYKW